MGEKAARLRLDLLFEEILSEGTKAAARQAGDLSSWTRHRDMPLKDIILCTLAKKGLTTTMEVRKYFQEAEKAERTVSKQAYLKQRQKLNPEAIKLFNLNYLKRFYDSGEAEEWQGHIVFAADGSRAEIPNSAENRREYGESVNKYGKGAARANLSILHDVFNRFILDVYIDRYEGSEIEAAKAHIQALKEIAGGRSALILFDRNYVSLEFMDFLEKSGVKYLIRLHKTDYKAEAGGMHSGDEEVELKYTNARLRSLKHKNPERAAALAEQKSGFVRIVKVRFDNGEEASFVTNLREGTASDIQDLYRKRWSIEKKYHTLKNKLKFESVTGKASIYVPQDFWAQTLVFNIVQDLITEAESRAAEEAKRKRLKYEVRINENIAIGLFKEIFIRLMMEENSILKEQMFKKLIADMEKNIVPVRSLKSAPRKWKYFNKYKCNQKPAF